MTALHHVQLACPPGGEDGARRFWVDGLGLREVAKPDALAGRGGCWFGDRDEHEAVIHVGVEEPFHPARKAHPALLVEDVAAVEARLRAAGFEPDLTERDTFPGHRRLHVADAHGNRVDILQPLAR